VGSSGTQRAWGSLGRCCDRRCPLLYYSDRNCNRPRRRGLPLSAQGRVGRELCRLARCAPCLAGPRQRFLAIAGIAAGSSVRLSIGSAFTQRSRVVLYSGPSRRAGGLSSERDGGGSGRGSPWLDGRCNSRGRNVWSTGELRPSLEDWLGAGAVIAACPGSHSPEASLAAAAFSYFREDLSRALRGSGSGKELIERGFGLDVDLAAELNVSTNVPRLVTRAFITATESP
jgi:hypothetical protein